MHIDEKMVLGLDVGIGSVGWCLLREYDLEDQLADDQLAFEIFNSPPAGGQITPSLGACCMDVPEDAKTKELLNVKRRDARRARRTIKRKAKRMAGARRLLAECLCPQVADVKAFHLPKGESSQLNPWKLRLLGLERLLTDVEFSAALLHLCKHRGFKSNSKKDAADKEGGAVLSAIKLLKEALQENNARTFGEYMSTQDRQRNRKTFSGTSDYSRTPLRSLLEEETRILFAKQRDFGNAKATTELEECFIDLAFTQRPLASTSDLIGWCSFLENERRAPKFSPTAERFRLAQRLTILRLKESDQIRGFTPQEIETVLKLLGEQKGVTYKALRKLLKLPEKVSFEGLSYRDKKGEKKDPESEDIASRTKGCGPGSHALCSRLGREAYARLRDLELPTGIFCLDQIAKILSDFDDKEAIQKELQALPLTEDELAALRAGVDKGDFAAFKGTMNLSLKAMQAILPEMIQIGDYYKGCELAGFDPAKTRSVDPDAVRNPVVLRILREVRRQFKAIIREFNVIPGRIHVELMRDVGKSIEDRRKIEKGMKDNRENRQKERECLAKKFGDKPESITATELRRYALWKQQGHKCAYYLLQAGAGNGHLYSGVFQDGGIPVEALRDSARLTEIDHILPYSRTSDNSFHNQALCLISANQSKGGQTPYEWLGQKNPKAWHAFGEWVKSLPAPGLKRRNFLMENLDQAKENVFHERNLHDSSYAARLVMRLLEKEMQKLGVNFVHEDGRGKRRIFARPGGITAYLRNQWGANSLKYDSAKKRLGDRHHALDAMVLAACSEGLLQKVTKVFKAKEEHKPEQFPEPQILLPLGPADENGEIPYGTYPFRKAAEILLGKIMVSRAERAKTKGPLHEETMRSIRLEEVGEGREEQVLYERKSVKGLTLESLKDIKDPQRCPDMIEKLHTWIEAGKPEDDLPRSNTGDVIKRVKVKRGPFRSGLTIRRGDAEAQVDNARWVRADVYQKDGKFYLVPVFTWQVARDECPRRAILRDKPENEWPLMDDSFTFLFSMHPNSYVRTKKKDVVKEGYYIGADKSKGTITLADPNDREEKMRGIGVKTLGSLEKYRVDRMGRIHRVHKEPRP